MCPPPGMSSFAVLPSVAVFLGVIGRFDIPEVELLRLPPLRLAAGELWAHL